MKKDGANEKDFKEAIKKERRQLEEETNDFKNLEQEEENEEENKEEDTDVNFILKEVFPLTIPEKSGMQHY